MKPKAIKTLYWIFTILFALLMALSAIPSLIKSEDSIKLLHDLLGYPVYFIQFTGAAKLLGVIAILIPGFNKIKEWAYAGLFFDLTGAVYSNVAAAHAFDPNVLFMLVWIVPGVLSYIFWHKKINT